MDATIDLQKIFSDADQDPLTFTAASSNSQVVSTRVYRNQLIVTFLASGTAQVTVTADDQRGGRVSSTFGVTSILAAPTAPTNVRVTPQYKQIKLAWTPVATASSYRVHMSTSSGQDFNLLASDVTQTEYTVGNLTYGSTYYFVITASNASGESTKSQEVSGATVLPATTIYHMYAYPEDVMVFWNTANGAKSYKVFYSTERDSGFIQAHPTLTLTNTMVSIRNLQHGRTYHFKVIAVYDEGESDFSNIGSVYFK